MLLVLVSYDITDPARLRRVAITMKDFGTRVQKSVFECLLTKELLEKCENKISGIIDPEKDSVRFYKFCKICLKDIKIMGVGDITEDKDIFLY